MFASRTMSLVLRPLAFAALLAGTTARSALAVPSIYQVDATQSSFDTCGPAPTLRLLVSNVSAAADGSKGTHQIRLDGIWGGSADPHGFTLTAPLPPIPAHAFAMLVIPVTPEEAILGRGFTATFVVNAEPVGDQQNFLILKQSCVMTATPAAPNGGIQPGPGLRISPAPANLTLLADATAAKCELHANAASVAACKNAVANPATEAVFVFDYATHPATYRLYDVDGPKRPLLERRTGDTWVLLTGTAVGSLANRCYYLTADDGIGESRAGNVACTAPVDAGHH